MSSSKVKTTKGRAASGKITEEGGRMVRQAKSLALPSTVYSYTEKDAILYALGVGVSTADEDFTTFLYERTEEFTPLPTFGTIPIMDLCLKAMHGGIPGIPFDPAKVLHGEQYLELLKPLPRSGKLTTTLKIADIIDKKSGALIIMNFETVDELGERVIFNQMGLYAVGAGNFGGPRTSEELIPIGAAPMREPDACVTEKTSVDQATLYRLSGDTNALHIDPKEAHDAGFQAPLLHGLCSFGFATRHVMKTFAMNDMTQFKDAKVRFVQPVLPGQTLQTNMWREENRIYFQTKVVENDTLCMSGAYIDLHHVLSSGM